MNQLYFEIKDRCRENLLPFLDKALAHIPVQEIHKTLDLGCGTGVPALHLAKKYKTEITGLDKDKPSLDWFEKKAGLNRTGNSFTFVNQLFTDTNWNGKNFDLVLAEGFLHDSGFKESFQKALKIIRPGGYFIIHDSIIDLDCKSRIITEGDIKVIDQFEVGNKIWWHEYFQCLDFEIRQLRQPELKELFTDDLKDIRNYHLESPYYKSVYFVLQKNS